MTKEFIKWRIAIEKQVHILNTGYELGLNEPEYAISYRGKNRRLVLTRDGTTLAYGMHNITQTLLYLRGIKNLFDFSFKGYESVDEWLESYLEENND